MKKLITKTICIAVVIVLCAGSLKAENSCEIALLASPAIGGTVIGSGIYEQGDEITVSAVANPDYNFYYWTEDNVVVSTNPDYSFIVEKSRTLIAHFTSTTFEIVVLPNYSSCGETTGGGIYEYGDEVTVSAVSGSCCYFVKWTENYIEVSPDLNYTFTVTGNRTLVADFMYKYYHISVSANPPEGGDVIPGGDACVCGEVITERAEASPGYVFVNWTENDVVVSTNATYTFTVTKSRNLVANFKDDGSSIETIENDAVEIYPNPTTGVLNLIQERIEGVASHARNDVRIEKIGIFDVFGRKAPFNSPEGGKSPLSFGEGAGMRLDISNLPNGIYFLRIQTNNGIVTKKIVKK